MGSTGAHMHADAARPAAPLLLIRHAHADWIADEMRPLSSAGRQAAAALAGRLAELEIARIVSSPYTRALQTVQPLARLLELEVEPIDDLRERTLGTVAARDFEPTVHRCWREPQWALPDGESNRAAAARVARAIDALPAPAGGGAIAVSTHGNALALYLQSLDPAVDFDFWRQLRMPDAYRVWREDGRPRWQRC